MMLRLALGCAASVAALVSFGFFKAKHVCIENISVVKLLPIELSEPLMQSGCPEGKGIIVQGRACNAGTPSTACPLKITTGWLNAECKKGCAAPATGTQCISVWAIEETYPIGHDIIAQTGICPSQYATAPCVSVYIDHNYYCGIERACSTGTVTFNSCGGPYWEDTGDC